MKPPTLRTWIEIDRKNLRHNVGEFFRLIHPKTRFMAVIKSNAYGHGLVLIAQEMVRIPAFCQQGWFGVDSIVEALRLRREGIVNPILVLGFTLSVRLEEAAEKHISVSISNFDALASLVDIKKRPAIHIKFDTGMHRQGFLKKDILRLITVLKKKKIAPEGIFTHFAAAKDAAYPTYTLAQLAEFQEGIASMEQAGFSGLIKHAAASGGTILFPQAHLDMVRIGMGIYGYWPSEETKNSNEKMQIRAIKKFSKTVIARSSSDEAIYHSKVEIATPRNGARNDTMGDISLQSQIILKPVLTWKTIVGEVKKIPKGSFVGYDLTERTHRNTTIAILPIGYWHGYDRGFSSVGQVLIRNARARIVGRVSMDMLIVDVTDILSVRVGDEVVIIGRQGREVISAEDMGRMIGTSAYEVVTRINPLIKRMVA